MLDTSARPTAALLTASSEASEPKAAATSQPWRSAMCAPARFSTASRGLTPGPMSAPDLVRHAAEQLQLVSLVVEGDEVPRQRRGEAALRAEAQPIERHVLAGLFDPPLELVRILELRLLGRDQA